MARNLGTDTPRFFFVETYNVLGSTCNIVKYFSIELRFLDLGSYVSRVYPKQRCKFRTKISFPGEKRITMDTLAQKSFCLVAAHSVAGPKCSDATYLSIKILFLVGGLYSNKIYMQ